MSDPVDGLASNSLSSRHPAVRCAVLIVGAFCIVLAGVDSSLFDLDRYTLSKELALHATALVSVMLLAAGWRRIEVGVIDGLLLVFLAWSAASSLLAANHWLALRAFAVSASGFVVWRAARAVARDGFAHRLLAGVVTAAVLAAALGAAQAYGFDIPWLATERPPGATFGNRNFLAHLLVIAVPALAVGAIRAPGRVFVLAIAALLLVTGTIILTRSRAAWLALAAQLGVFMIGGLAILRAEHRSARLDAHAATRGTLERRPGVQRRIALVALAVATGAALAVLLPNSLEWRSDSPYAETLTRLADYREGSGRGRLIQYRNTLQLVRSDPIMGVGPGNWMVAYPRVTTPGDPSYAGVEPIPTNPWPSSDWIAMLAERGFIGVLLLLAAGLAIKVTAARRLLTAEPRAIALDAIIALGTLVGVAVTGLFDAVLLLGAPTFFAWTILGATLPPTTPVRSWSPSPRIRRALNVAAVAVLLAFTADAAGGVVAIVMSGDGRNREAVERALDYDPGNHRLHLILARRGPCRERLPHARAARDLLPEHPAPRQALLACGEAG